ncbi:probable E3 SUMO-protein ligase RNF212 [Protopterus annectens]|uniref:probable E3 SUMO-protein ligase RNF212 n=1 Tax=Protopterus annectens TaxID=7888 RepID=UPI001CF96E7B|nr:probable E3 SUMO-protein ligase RNF212 [Protopterus annectens]
MHVEMVPPEAEWEMLMEDAAHATEVAYKTKALQTLSLTSDPERRPNCPTLEIIGGRSSLHQRAWLTITKDIWVERIISRGYKQMNPDIRALFTSIDALCKQYSKEVSRIYEFQEKQRRRFLKFCEGKIAKLNKSLNVMHQRQQPESTSMGPPSSAKVLKPSNTVLDPSQSRSATHHSLSSLSSDM